MSEIVHHYPIINGREIHVREWNPEGIETIFCSHGLARNSIDFFELGTSLASKGYRVIAPDSLGRGLSQWAIDPKKEYTYENYVDTALQLLDFFSCARAHWIGSCMGGLIGLLIASDFSHANRITSLILNDIGPEVPDNAIKRIVNYIQAPIEFSRYSEINQYLKALFKPLGTHTPQQWEKIITGSIKRLDSGKFTTNYDPKILVGYKSGGSKINLWRKFSKIKQPIFLMNGLQSDVLTKEIVKKMRVVQPKMSVYYYLNCGHAPNLCFKSHIEDVEHFIEKNAFIKKQEKGIKAS